MLRKDVRYSRSYRRSARWLLLHLVAFNLVAASASGAHAAEYGTGPWLKGYSDIYAGVVPSQPGFYFRSDAYHYKGDVDTTIFNGRVQLGVEQEFLMTIFALNYVSPWKILGGTYAAAVGPSVVAMDVDVALSRPRLGTRRRTIGRTTVNTGDTNVAQGDTVLAPLILGWESGNFYWNFALFSLAPTGDYSTQQLANTSLNHWAAMPRLAATYSDPESGWEISGAAIYSVSWENPATDYETGNILNLEGAITKNFGPFGVGVVGYGMIQVTGDSGAGARLGAHESRVYSVGPILTFTTSADPTKALTILAKWYHEFDAENTLEGDVVDFAVSFRF